MAEPIEGQIYRSEDWYGEEIADRQYVACEFHDVDLTEATSSGAVFTECVFGNVRLNSSTHTDSAFVRCSFSRCSLFDAEFTGCKLVGSTLRRPLFGRCALLAGIGPSLPCPRLICVVSPSREYACGRLICRERIARGP